MFKFFKILLNLFLKNFREFLNFGANCCIIVSKFFNSLWWVHLCWMSLRTEILATPLLYRTWKVFMYEIFLDISPSNQNSGARPVCRIYILYIYVVTCAPFQIFIRGGPHVIYVLLCSCNLNTLLLSFQITNI